MLHAVAEQRDSVNNRGGRTSTLKRFSKLGYLLWSFIFVISFHCFICFF